MVNIEVLSEHFHISYWNLLYGKHGDGRWAYLCRSGMLWKAGCGKEACPLALLDGT
jgi:hypothetical protein